MKTYLFRIAVLLIVFTVITKDSNAQIKIYVPDDNFEKKLMELGIDKENPPLINDTVIVNGVESIKTLFLLHDGISGGITDLTGIEAFIELEVLEISDNSINILNLSSNLKLKKLVFMNNFPHPRQPVNLDLSKHSLLEHLECLVCEIGALKFPLVSNLNYILLSIINSPFSDLDFSKQINLEKLIYSRNWFPEVLDLGYNNNLRFLDCSDNNLKCLNIRNGNNDNLTFFDCSGNSNLDCVQVDDILSDLGPPYSRTCPCASEMYSMNQICYQNITSCLSHTSPSGKYTWTSNGIYRDTIVSNSGRDSIIITKLTIIPASRPTIDISGDTLKSINSYKEYQWFNEVGLIPGATQKKYVINQSGNYFLLITDDNDCTNTSDKINVIHTDLKVSKSRDFEFAITPNPNAGLFTCRVFQNLKKEFTLKLLNSTGQVIETRFVEPTSVNHIEQFDVSHLRGGMYYLVISTESSLNGEKIIVQ